QFDHAAHTGQGVRGALITIDQTPFTAARFFANEPSSPRQARAQAVLDKLKNESEQSWQQIAKEDGTTATTLSALGVDRSAQLIYHGYVVAMMNSHIVLGYPLLSLPARQRFVAL